MEGTPNPGAGGEQPTQEELRAQIEEQLRQVRVQDLLVESTASIVNLTARRIAKEDERDLEQARVGIEAVRALAGLIEGEVAEQIQGALSELQLIYARAAKGEPLTGEGGQGAAAGEQPPAGGPQAPPTQPQGQQRREPPPKLWTPGP